MDDKHRLHSNVSELALRLLRLEEELAVYRKLHEEELRGLEARLSEMRVALVRVSEGEDEAERVGSHSA